MGARLAWSSGPPVRLVRMVRPVRLIRMVRMVRPVRLVRLVRLIRVVRLVRPVRPAEVRSSPRHVESHLMNERPLNAAEPGVTQLPLRLRFTLVSGALVLGAYHVLQIAATIFLAIMLDLDPFERMGDLIALGVIFSAIPCTLLVKIILDRHGRARGIDPRSWLALLPVRVPTLLGWLVFAFVLLQLADLVTVELGRELVPPIMETIIETTRYTTLLWIAIVIAAPVFEEVLFRGFLYEGLRRTRIGAGGTIVVTTLLWALLHAGQYDLYYVGLIALIGIMLGIARERTGSLYVPLAIHGMNNLLSTLQMTEERDALVNALF